MELDIPSNRSLEQTLQYFIRLQDETNKTVQTPVVVNVGCSHFFEFEVLQKMYGKHIFGLDIDTERIRKLKQKYPEQMNQFISGNAEVLQTYIEHPIDLIIARHPNVYKDPWESIFNACYEAQPKHGKLLSTCYFSNEAEKVVKLLQKAKYNVWFCDKNISHEEPEFSKKELEHLDISSEDKFVIAASKY